MSNEIVPVNEQKPIPTNKFIIGSDISEYKDQLVEKYRKKQPGVLQKIEKNPNLSSDEIMGSIVEDILRDSESLLGNQLIFTEEGNLRDATTITINRSNLLKAVADIAAKRKELNQKANDVDLNSPAFMLFQKMCFEKMVGALEELEFLDEEEIQLVLDKWAKSMSDWGKELKAKLDEIAQ